MLDPTNFLQSIGAGTQDPEEDDFYATPLPGGDMNRTCRDLDVSDDVSKVETMGRFVS